LRSREWLLCRKLEGTREWRQLADSVEKLEFVRASFS
jgi:hypothetical protein